MATENGSWHLVQRGLDFKLVGLILFAGLPALAVGLVLNELDLRWLLVGLGAAAIPDFIGRCLCLAAPVANRWTIMLSVAFQAVALAVVAGLGLTGDPVQIGMGISLGAGLQIVSAVMFTTFLRTAGETLRCPVTTERARQLTSRLTDSLFAGSGYGVVFFVLAAVVLVISIVTCGAGLFIAGPVALLVLLPITVLTGGVIVRMYWTYASAMTSLRTAIREALDAEMLEADTA